MARDRAPGYAYRNLTEAQQQARKIACPECLARPEQACIRADGTDRKDAHQVRARASRTVTK